MPDITHTVIVFASQPLASLMLAISLAFILIITSERIWWIHAPLGLLFLIVSIAFHDQRNLSFDSFLVGLFSFPAICRDIPNQPLLFRVGICWFASFSLIAAVIYAAGGQAQHAAPRGSLLSERADFFATIERAI